MGHPHLVWWQGMAQFALGFVEGDFGEVGGRVGEVDDGLRGWVVAPGAYGVEVGEEVRAAALRRGLRG